jgi:hypothetical protein
MSQIVAFDRETGELSLEMPAGREADAERLGAHLSTLFAYESLDARVLARMNEEATNWLGETRT